MNRRAFFGRLVGAASCTVPLPHDNVELWARAQAPLMAWMPMCPRCGGACYFERHPHYAYGQIPVGEPVPVVCGYTACGWRGAAPLAVKVGF